MEPELKYDNMLHIPPEVYTVSAAKHLGLSNNTLCSGNL